VFSELTCVGLDILPRALGLAEAELTAAGVRHRVELREQNVQDLSEEDAFDVAWVPLPLLSEAAARDAISRVSRALRPGGWLVVAANRPDPHPDALDEAVGRLRVLAVGGCRALRDEVGRWLDTSGVVEVHELPLPPYAPVILVGRVSRKS
jgi:SAM-dependent methyltransferase